MAPNSPKLQVSSTLRPLVGVLAIGAILLLLVVSAAEALETLRAELKREGRPEGRRKGRFAGERGYRRLASTSRQRRSPPGLKGARAEADDGGHERSYPARADSAGAECSPDGTSAPPGELTLPSPWLCELTGIKPNSMRAATRKLRKKGKIERDERGWWSSARMQRADNGTAPRRPPEQPVPRTGKRHGRQRKNTNSTD